MKAKNVAVQNLTKTYQGQGGKQVTAVQDVSLAIVSGEFVTLLGPSGCGKTTILRIIAGFETPTGGEVYIGGERVTQLPPDKRETAMVFQSYALFPHLKVYDNIAYGPELRNLSKSEIGEKVEHMLQLAGLTGLEGRYPNQLSGGQQQRVALARAMIMEPSVLLFDEPLSNLDAKLRVHMRAEIRKLQKKAGTTSIYVTHDQAEAMSMSDRIIVMNNGVIEQVGTPADIYNRPVSEFVADFIGMANILAATVTDSTAALLTIDLFGSRFSLPSTHRSNPGDAVKVVLRPEAVRLSARGGLSAVVESSVYMGNHQDYRLRVNGQSFTVYDYKPSGRQIFAEGETVCLDIGEEAIHIIGG